ncbi:transcription factor Adf-1-like isoform X2 [Coccinella septempunctata]|uniref:transcription factor Adf-1-like isoform X2 n=1 Tax=Coccinella septempunctata TaxID=41139 RepID=UPI001D096A58|nr:transcription factor Adf-1-like isoform X2 [Coccinella septempunctata]
MCSAILNKEKDEMLIEFVKCNPVLYDASHSDYKSYVLKHKVWENISKSLEIPDVKKRWKHLRDHYMKKKKATSGTGLNHWEYMSKLTFLSQAPSQRLNLTNAENSEVTETQEAIDDTQDNSLTQEGDLAVQNTVLNDVDSDATSGTSNVSVVPVTPSLSRKRKKSNVNSSAAILERRQEDRSLVLAKLLSQQTKSPIYKFFDAMADIVSEFPPHLIAEARHKVFEAVHEIEMKMYYEQSTPYPVVIQK